jgi:ABC-2 type transport system ATP-binding protein
LAAEAVPVVAQPVVRVSGVTRSFGAVHALRGVDLTVRPGEVLVLVGPNGAGKTTLTRIVATLDRPDGGTIEIFGEDPWRDLCAVRRRLSVVPQNVAPDPMLTGREQAYYYLRARGHSRSAARERIAEVFEAFGLAEMADRPTLRLSGGFQRRVVLAMAVAAGGELILLDEPTVALDPLMRRRTWNLITELSRHSAVLLTTHDMAEAEALGSRVAVLDQGMVLAETTVTELRRILPSGDKIVSDAPYDLVATLGLAECGQLEPLGMKTVLYPSSLRARRLAAKRLLAADLPFAVQATTLDDVYVHLLERPDAPGQSRPAVRRATAP